MIVTQGDGLTISQRAWRKGYAEGYAEGCKEAMRKVIEQIKFNTGWSEEEIIKFINGEGVPDSFEN